MMSYSFRLLPKRRNSAQIARAAAVVLTFLVLVHLSLRLIVWPHGLAMVWPAAGLSLATLACSLRRRWPSLGALFLVASTLAHHIAGFSLLISLGLALAHVGGSLVAAVLLCWQPESPLRLRTLRDVLRFVLLAPLAANSFTALLGATVATFAFGTPFLTAWRMWWVADGLGMLVVGTLIMTWVCDSWTVSRSWARRAEAAGLMLVLLVSSLLLLGTTPTFNSFSSPYLIFPVLIWAALRFGLQGASAAVAWVSVVVVLVTINEIGPFALLDLPLAEQVIRAQLFLFVVCLSTFTLAAVMCERQEVQKRLLQTNLALERRVAERTAALTAINAEQKAAQERLRESEATLQAALDGGLLGAWSWNPATNHVVADARTLELFGIDPTEFTNDASMSFSRIHPEDRPTVQAALEHALHPDGQYDAEFRVVLPNGDIRWLAGAGRARWDADGQVILVYGVNADITERKRAEHMTHFLLELDAALALLADADEIEQMTVNRLGSFLNVAWCSFAQIFGHSSNVVHAYRQDGSDLFGRRDLETFFSPETLARFAHGHTLVVHDVTADERTLGALALYQELRIGAFVATPVLYQGHWIGALVLVSMAPRAWRADEVHLVHEVAARAWPRLEQARAQAALRASEARLQVLYEQEQAARTQAEEASRVKDEFLAIVSHELRTPLTAFLGYTQLLQNHPCDDRYIVQTVEKMFQSAKVQTQLIEDLLDVSRIVSGKLQIEARPLDLRGVIREALDVVRPAIDTKAQQLQLDLPAQPVRIVGDPNRLQQVVWNLLANATKFTPPGGAITVRLVRRGQSAELLVSDTGQGIRPDFLPFVFERFRQAEGSSNRRHRGLGLGLAIVRHLVELHGGTVEAASPGEGQGATFTVCLPLASRDQPFPPAVQPPGARDSGKDSPSRLAGVRVLLVDDQPDILEVVRQILSGYGALVRPCTTARKALDLVPMWKPDVLVSDIAMPGEDGYWLLYEVRTLAPEQGGTTPAVALTACVQAEDQLRVLAAGFQGYVPKPVDPRTLYTVIADLVRSRQRET